MESSHDSQMVSPEAAKFLLAKSLSDSQSDADGDRQNLSGSGLCSSGGFAFGVHVHHDPSASAIS